MQLTNDELNKELYAMAAEAEAEPEQVLKMLQENQALDELQFRAISRKVGDFLLNNAEVQETVAA
jgi:FKBP-type peptidyl-prolyl cis-trans isomerase (trigger factor)